MRPTKSQLLEMLLNTLNDSYYQQYFPVRDQQEWANLGYTAKTNGDSKIFQLLHVLAMSLEEQLSGYILPEPPEPKEPTEDEIKELQVKAKEKEKEDIQRYQNLETAWKADKPRADKEDRENAEKIAQALFDKVQEQKKIMG
jgi:hypothetical protein